MKTLTCEFVVVGTGAAGPVLAYYLARAEAVRGGSWQSEAYYGTTADGMVNLAPFGPSVDDETQALILTRQAEIIDGTFQVFPDPIVDHAKARDRVIKAFKRLGK